MKINRLNNLDSATWLKFQKSWFIHNPPPRKKSVLTHPAKFPETLAGEFIEFFTKEGETVLDPMAGAGSALVAALRAGRHAVGIELNPRYADIARGEIERETAEGRVRNGATARIITADARDLDLLKLPPCDYCLTSPPYWDMLRMKGAHTQKARREKALDVAYSDHPDDLGNIDDYDRFLRALVKVYRKVHAVLRDRAYLTVVVKNVKKQGKIYPLAWDLGREVGKFFALKDERIWCQNDQRLAPYGLGNAWVSNTLHHYCLNFRKK
ncbi:MAG: site-specific DNA-methyltransferase [Candidatus Zixiibacteriota bacterium]|nr:MAG: site-specific DNA-methyltransferase [candidate division Zixibacteria bacterium]